MFREVNHSEIILGSALRSSNRVFKVNLTRGIRHVLISKGEREKQLSNLSLLICF